MGKILTREEFIARAKDVHGDRYDYSKVEYKGNNIHICIVCPVHGEFWQTPHNHLRGQNCPHCAIKGRTGNKNNFIAKARTIHGDKYDYSKVEYVDVKTKVRIVCPVHGEFLQRPDIHLKGCICPKCSNDNRMNGLEFYIELSKKIHGDKYDFSNSIYLGATKEIEVRCKKCGNIFFITPYSLIRGTGCKMCNIEEERKVPCLYGEEWRDIMGFGGYQVSNLGRVRSIDRIISVGKHQRKVVGVILKLNYDKDGYKMVSLRNRKRKSNLKRVHRLVAKAFIPNPNGYDCIDHINGVRDDNRVENLRWCTVKMNSSFELALENRSKAIKNSYIKNPSLRKVRAETFRKSLSIRVEVFKNDVSLGIFNSQKEAADFLGIRQSLISNYMRGVNANKNGITIKKL